MSSTNRQNKIRLARFRQTPNFCGPAVLKMVFDYFGKNLTEKELVDLTAATPMSPDTTRGTGTEHEGLIRAIKAVGGYGFAKEHGTNAELEYFIQTEKLPVIIGWFDRDDDHYSIVVRVTDKNIIIVDPAEDKKERRLSRQFFPKIWFDFVGPKDEQVSWGWFLVVSFAPKKFAVNGGQYY
ncbi:MAG: cysteine peptidase family C39 domain-containing protein [Patescibacteria group bacterium]